MSWTLILNFVSTQVTRPKFIAIFTDDQGYQDLGSFGSSNDQGTGIPSTIRQRHGIDVAAGCRQLKAKRAKRTRSGA